MQQPNEVQGRVIVRGNSTCSYCRMVGHNRRTCRVRRETERVVQPAVQPAVQTAVQPAVQPAVRRPGRTLYYGLGRVDREQAIQYRNLIIQSRFMGSITEADIESMFRVAVNSMTPVEREQAIQYRNLIIQSRFMGRITEADMEMIFLVAVNSTTPVESVSRVAINLLRRSNHVYDLAMQSNSNTNVASTLIENYSGFIRNMLKYVEYIKLTISVRDLRNPRNVRVPRVVTTTKTHIKNLQILRCMDEEETGRETTCTICMDELETTNIIHTNCKHVYCLDCVSGYMNSIKDKTCLPTCPMCRGKLDRFNTYSDGIHVELTNTIQAL